MSVVFFILPIGGGGAGLNRGDQPRPIMELPETANALTAVMNDLIESYKMEDFDAEVTKNALQCGA
ncbi:unnamed protein product, partial [marine sediment metagenome]